MAAARFKTTFALAAAITLAPAPIASSIARENCVDDAMIVFDGSGSMSEVGFNELSEPRIFEARQAVRRSMPSIANFRRLGLIIYGPGTGDGCSNIDLRFEPAANAAGRIIAEIDHLMPDGDTPLTESVRAAAEILNFRDRPGTVVLITDGKETCGGQACDLAATLAADGLDLTVHVIGFKVRSDYFSWGSQGAQGHSAAQTVARCLADRTGGHYVATENVDELAAALHKTLGCSLIGGLPAPDPLRHAAFML